MYGYLIFLFLFLPITLSAQHRDNKHCQSNRKAQFNRKQNRLESQTSWREIKRKRDTRRMLWEESVSRSHLYENRYAYKDKPEPLTLSLMENQVYTVPNDLELYILIEDIQDNQVTFYKNTNGEVLKTVKAISENSILVMNGAESSDKKVLIQKYIKATSGSMISVLDDAKATVVCK